MKTLAILTKCLPLACLTGCSQATPLDGYIFWNSPACITLIICATIIVLALIIKEMISIAKQPKQKANTTPGSQNVNTRSDEELKKDEIERTRKLYQDRLIGFMEKRAMKKETITKDGVKTETTRDFDKDLAQAFIARMEQLIKELTPKQ